MSHDLSHLALFALIAAAVVPAVLLPLARWIPARMRAQWLEQMEQDGYGGGAPAPVSRFKLGGMIAMSGVGALLGALAAWLNADPLPAAMLCVYLLGLLLLFAINFNSGFLPDHTVLTLLWGGVLWWTWQGDPASSVLGAVLAYLVPFVLLWVFKAVKGIHALGGGDVKTLAMAGAWLGVGNVPMLLGVFLGLVVVVMLVEALMAGPGKVRRIGTGPGHLAASVMVLTMPYLSA